MISYDLHQLICLSLGCGPTGSVLLELGSRGPADITFRTMVGQSAQQSQVWIAAPSMKLLCSLQHRQGTPLLFALQGGQVSCIPDGLQQHEDPLVEAGKAASSLSSCTWQMGCRQGSSVYECCHPWCCSCSTAWQLNGLMQNSQTCAIHCKESLNTSSQHLRLAC